MVAFQEMSARDISFRILLTMTPICHRIIVDISIPEETPNPVVRVLL
jgi:hypothetical protein